MEGGRASNKVGAGEGTKEAEEGLVQDRNGKKIGK